MKNAIVACENLLVESQNSMKMLLDVPFKKYVTQHKENVKEVD